jgi:hypothetical protein
LALPKLQERGKISTRRGLSSDDEIDTDRNGVISMAELTAYMAKHLDELTGGDRQLGLEQRFQGDLFVSGL